MFSNSAATREYEPARATLSSLDANMIDNGRIVPSPIDTICAENRETSNVDSPEDHICLAFIFKFSVKNPVHLLRCCAYDDEETSHPAHSLLHSHFMDRAKGVALWGHKLKKGSTANSCPLDCGACTCLLLRFVLSLRVVAIEVSMRSKHFQGYIHT